MRSKIFYFPFFLLLAMSGYAQSPNVDGSVTLLSDSLVRAEPGEFGFLEFEVTNLGPDTGLVRLTSSFGLEGEIPITLYDERFGQPPGTPVSCAVAQAISNPTPLVTYLLDPLPFLQPFASGETRVCRIQYGVRSSTSGGTFSFDVEAGDENDPNVQNNSVTVEFEIGRQLSPFAIPTMGRAMTILLLLLLMVAGARKLIPRDKVE